MSWFGFNVMIIDLLGEASRRGLPSSPFLYFPLLFLKITDLTAESRVKRQERKEC